MISTLTRTNASNHIIPPPKLFHLDVRELSRIELARSLSQPFKISATICLLDLCQLFPFPHATEIPLCRNRTMWHFPAKPEKANKHPAAGIRFVLSKSRAHALAATTSADNSPSYLKSTVLHRVAQMGHVYNVSDPCFQPFSYAENSKLIRRRAELTNRVRALHKCNQLLPPLGLHLL